MNISNRPNYADDISSILPVDYAHLTGRADELAHEAARLPDEITDKESHDAAVDLAAKVRGHQKTIEANRVEEKEPFLKAERAVDGFFKPLDGRLAKIASEINQRVTVYLRKVADEKRRQAEAEERKRREEADRLRQEAMERERKAEEARRADHREQHREAASEASHQATLLEMDAIEHGEIAGQSAADLARSRSDHGTLSTLKTEWVGTIEDIRSIPLDELRPYIPVKTIEAAIKAYIRNGGRQLKGVRIEQIERAMIR